jgi:hypothetical protein
MTRIGADQRYAAGAAGAAEDTVVVAEPVG